MRFSYSRVECFAKCPYQYYLRYVEKLKTLPDQQANNALYLGNALHLGMETKDVDKAIENYLSNYYDITEEMLNEVIKLEHLLPRALQVVPDGKSEVKIETDDFTGFIDRLVPTYLDDKGIQHHDLYDYKYTNNGERYKDSPQLHIYKYYYELTHPNEVIDHLYYVIVSKVGIRQKFKAKPPETVYEFRERLQQYLEVAQIYLMEVEYDEGSITYFQEACQYLRSVKDFPKNQTKLCGWCNYKDYCESNGQKDWMIINKERKDNLELPKNEKKALKKEKITSPPDMYIYGASYVGKSTFVDSLDDVLFLNTDGNSDMYQNPSLYINKTSAMNGRMKIDTSAWENFLSVIEELEKKQNTFKYVCLDLVEDLREHCRVYMCQKLKIPHESDSSYSKAWDMVTTEFNQAIKRLKSAGYTIIYISKEVSKEVSPRNGVPYTTYKPNMQEKAANMLAGTVKVTCRVYADENGKRWMSLNPNVHEFGGGRFNFKNDTCELSMTEFLKALNDAEVRPNGAVRSTTNR